MKRLFSYLLVYLLGCSVVFAQSGAAGTSTALDFQDSVRITLLNTKAIEFAAIGDSFGTSWISLGPEDQQAIKRQVKLMKKKGFTLRTHFINYYGCIVSAITKDKTDPALFRNFLTVLDKVLEKENKNQVAQFLQQAYTFFDSHALTNEKFFHLNIKDDSYEFAYLEPVPQDTSQTTLITQTIPDSVLALMPQWQQPVAQPEILGPAIIFKGLTFNFVTTYDSVFLKNTKGKFSLRDKIFVGEGGSFDWSSAGLPGDSVFYELKQYNFKTSQPEIKAEQGNLKFTGKLAGGVPGSFEFKSAKHKTKEQASYPRFKSYENNVQLLNFPKSLEYHGGFGLSGHQMNSSNVGNLNSTLIVNSETEKKFKLSAPDFTFKDSTVLTSRARIAIYMGNDSLVHPAVQVKYYYGKELLSVVKDKSSYRNAPFSSSYFGIDFNADELKWDLKSDSLNFFTQGSGNVSPMIIESNDFYDPEDFRQLRGQGFNFSALALVVNYANKNGTRDFNVIDLVDNKKDVAVVKMAADFLAQKGMIEYEPRTGKIRIKEKAIHFQASGKGEVDYDNMKIHSLSDTIANATINFKKRYMTVHGVQEFKISDSLNVVVKPDSSLITLLQNRDLKFKGTINAGNFEITGKDFMLKYDSFFINLNKIDSIRFYVTEKNGTRRRVNNSMVGADSTAAAAGGLVASQNKTSGTLFINRPDNKSGKIKYANYPRLDATSGGMIYFDRKEVLDGAYDRSVFFVIPPFKLDSLNDADPGSINFEGTFVSSGMFPSFKEKLHTMEDKSLGFTHSIPTNGYKLYKGDGKMFGGIRLDNSGLRSTGKIEYLAAHVESKDFTFYPDSVLAKGSIGGVDEKQFGNVNFPQITFGDYQLKWFPKQDKFKVKNLKESFSLYKNTASLNGYVTVSKTGVTGSGRMSTRGSEVVSREFNYASKEFGARHAGFQVKTGNPDKPALEGKDVRLKFNLEQNYATISPEIEGVAAIDFPYAQFKTSIPEARWDLNTQKIVMTKAANVPIENSHFYTTRKELDSLSFNAEKGEYDIRNQTLKVSGIPFIVVADAKITPENNEVLILENAKIGQLKNTTIVLDTLNGYHRLTEGVVDIISRKEFSGYATYQYVNNANDTFKIKMTDFHLEAIAEETNSRRKKNLKGQQTVSNGSVEEKDHILIAPRIYYKGDMTMFATLPALKLKGYVKLDLKKIKNYNTWLQYNQSGDEKDIYLDFDKAVTEDGSKVQAGLFFASDNSLYITFVSNKKDEGDEDFFLPSGSLFFDKESGQFKIEDRKKAAGEKLSGKVLNYNEEKQEVKFEGPVKFFDGFKDFNLNATAIGSGNLETNDIKMNSFIMASMNIPPMAYQLMAQNLLEIIKNEGLPEGLGDQTELLYKIANLIGEKAAKDYEQKSLQSYVSLATIPALAQPIVFSNVNLKWSQATKAFYNEGTIGVSNIGKNDINGAFEGFMEIRRNDDGTPVFHVFFKASPESWFYFGYEDNRLMIQSANTEFNDLITKKTNASKAKVGELVFIPGSDEEVLSFVNKFRLTYYGIEAPYDLTSGNSAAKKKDKKKDAKEDDGF